VLRGGAGLKIKLDSSLVFVSKDDLVPPPLWIKELEWY
jgi:hypothetical protein